MVMSEGVAQSAPLVAPETAPNVDRAELDAVVVASEGAAQSVPPVAQTTVLEVGRMEEDMGGGSLGVVAVVERTRRRSPPALLSGGSHSPTWGKPLL